MQIILQIQYFKPAYTLKNLNITIIKTFTFPMKLDKHKFLSDFRKTFLTNGNDLVYGFKLEVPVQDFT